VEKKQDYNHILMTVYGFNVAYSRGGYNYDSTAVRLLIKGH